MVAPALREQEALRSMVAEFAARIAEGRAAAHGRARRACGSCGCWRRQRSSLGSTGRFVTVGRESSDQGQRRAW